MQGSEAHLKRLCTHIGSTRNEVGELEALASSQSCGVTGVTGGTWWHESHSRSAEVEGTGCSGGTGRQARWRSGTVGEGEV